MTTVDVVREVLPALAGVGGHVALRATLLIAGAMVMAWGLRRASGAVRHALWTVTLVGLLALPGLTMALPSLPIPLPGASGAAAGVRAEAPRPVVEDLDVEAPASADVRFEETTHPGPSTAESPGARGGADPAASRTVPSRATGSTGVAAVWLLGVVGALGALVRGMLRVRRAARRGTPAATDGWPDSIGRALARIGLPGPVDVRISGDVSTAMTGGLVRPFVLLPPSAADWSEERRELVLLHELVHVRRRDALRQILGRVASALYWFHPLVWVASRWSVLAREQACDEAVLDLGCRPSTYARHLLELSEGPERVFPAPALLERPHLERRLMSVLDPRTRSRPRVVAAAVAFASLWALTVAAVVPREEPQERPSSPASVEVPAGAPANTAVEADGASLTAPAPTEPSTTPAPVTLDASPEPPQQVADRGCFVGGFRGPFSGSMSAWTDEEGRQRYRRFGYSEGDRVVQTNLEDQVFCLRTHGAVDFGADGLEEGTIGDDDWAVMGARANGRTILLELVPDGSGVRRRFTLDGEQREIGDDVRAWRQAMYAVLGAHWEMSRIRGEVSSLRGRISSIRGRESSLRGRISSIRGHVSSLRGRISSVRGQESSLRGRMSSARGHVSSLRGRISSIRGRESSMHGRVSSLQARLSRLSSASRATEDPDTRRRLEDEAEALREQITEAEAEIDAYDTAARVAEVEREIDEYDLESRLEALEAQIDEHGTEERIREIEAEIEAYDADQRVREVEAEIAELDVAGRVAEIEREIEALDADRRIAELEASVRADEERLMDLTTRLTARPLVPQG